MKLKGINSIIIFRALQLGDLLCPVPAFRALRLAYPDAHIAIAGMPWMKSFVERFADYIDEFIWFPGYPGLPEQEVDAKKTIGFLNEIAERKFDLALQMQGNGTIVNPMVKLFNAKYTAGYCIPNDYCPDKELFILYPEGISEIHKHLFLMNHLGIDLQGDHLEFPVTDKDVEDLSSASFYFPGEKYICVHPGSRGADRRWPPEYFARLADRCAANGRKIILTGTKEEIDIVNRVASCMKSKPLIAAGKTNIGAMAALLKNAEGLICNCTGVSHIAAALRTKSVVISMDGEPERWAPLNKDIHYTIDWTKTPDIDLVQHSMDIQFSISA
ncbi:MAG: glycosyltransferase family 9 protein [Chitinophagaceae bacterium]|nr:glycosyltransferase family 9 protein [Chitinophagaceae bacterium]